MNRMGSPFVQKIVPVSVIAVLLFCTPLHLAAQERESPHTQAPVVEWFASLWSNVAAWLTGGALPDPKPTPGGPSTSDGGGCLDPNGGCGG